MDVTPLLNSQFVQVALPIVITLVISSTYQNKRIDDLRSDMNRQFDEVKKELKEIRAARITRLEERTSPIHRN